VRELHPLCYEADEPTCGVCGAPHNSYGNSPGVLVWDCRRCDAMNRTEAKLVWTTTEVAPPTPKETE
jgi:tRNA(Ile2) C34 agmatinyltransferase TiaS